jgi:hypothetical protein
MSSLARRDEPERIAFARRLVATTDRAFQFINRDGAIARFVHVRLAPLLMPALFRFRKVRRLMFLTISQTNVNYRGSALSIGSAGRVEAGDRLPWEPQDTGTDNFASLRSLDWQAHFPMLIVSIHQPELTSMGPAANQDGAIAGAKAQQPIVEFALLR